MKYLLLLCFLCTLPNLHAQITSAQIDDFTGRYTVQSKRTTLWHNGMTGETFMIYFSAEDSLYYINAVWESRQVNETDYAGARDLLYLKLSEGQIIKAQPLGKFYARTFRTLFGEKQYLSVRYKITKTNFNLIRAYPIQKLRFTFFNSSLSVNVTPLKSRARQVNRNADAVWRLANK